MRPAVMVAQQPAQCWGLCSFLLHLRLSLTPMQYQALPAADEVLAAVTMSFEPHAPLAGQLLQTAL